MPKQASVPGTRAGRSFHVPVCSIHKERCQKNDVGEWFCPSCADEWLQLHIEKQTRGVSKGGVVLPTGSRDERRDATTPTFKDLAPNRRVRRAMRRAGRGFGA